MVGGPQIRNAGTIGGNTCNGVTSADSASTLHAWEAIVEITGKNGVRRVPIKDFYIKAGTVDLRVEDGEIQTAILIPKDSPMTGPSVTISSTPCATPWTSPPWAPPSTSGCSPDKKTFERVRIAFGVAGPVPLRALNAEALHQRQGRHAWRTSRAVRPQRCWRTSTPGIPGGPARPSGCHIAVESAKRCLHRVREAGGR